MKMKRIIALLMIMMMALPLVACQPGEDPTSTPTAGTESTATGTKAPETTEEKVELDLPLKSGTYELVHVGTGTKVETDKFGKLATGENVMFSQVSVDYVVNKDTAYYRIGLFGIEQVKKKNTDTIYDNVEVINCLALDKLKNNSPISVDYDSLNNNKEMWKLYANEDGTFEIAPLLKPTKARVGVVDGVLTLIEVDENTNMDNFKWQFVNKSTDNPIYYEYVSEKGNAIVRVPRDVFEKKNYPAAELDKETGKFESFVPTEKTLQKYAENVQLVWEVYNDLTNFTPYQVIIVHGYNYQGVMAGVVGNNNNVFVNCGAGEWFYDDLYKMEYRMTKLGVNDVNFMVLHEIGHMYDFDRGWTFESEMQADLKAAYLLHNIEGAVAAPAEFPAKRCFGKNIGTEGYNELSGGKMPTGVSDTNPTGYSIYRNAEIFTDFCANHIGWEALKKTFHWFQSSEGKKQAPSSAASYDKFKMFVDKLSEFGGKDLWAVFNPAELAVLEKRFEKPEEEPAE